MTKPIDTNITLASYYDSDKKLVKITVRKYYDYLNQKDQNGISEFIYQRLFCRYLKPFLFDNDDFKKEFRNGFSIMANCCLLIETLQSFRNGWGDTHKKSKLTFQQFLTTDKFFTELNTHQDDFYMNVRCGILHQGETNGGWKISRNYKKLFDTSTLTVDALTFLTRLEKSLKGYCEELKTEDWDSKTWKKCRAKVKKIIDNCQ